MGPGGFDPDPTFKKKSDPDPTVKEKTESDPTLDIVRYNTLPNKRNLMKEKLDFITDPYPTLY